MVVTRVREGRRPGGIEVLTAFNLGVGGSDIFCTGWLRGRSGEEEER